jgi:hypothetical protein
MKPLVNKKYKLEKYPGKGGWTYAVIPEITPDKRAAFGMVRVKGTIDTYIINRYTLMPMSNGAMFLPVKADIRKQIGKQAGDTVHVTLYHDDTAVEVPGEFTLCLQDEPAALRFFNKLTDNEKQHYIQWIYSARKEETKAKRMAAAINKLAEGRKYYDQM